MTLTQSNPEAIPKGEKAPEFILQNAADDKAVSLEDFAGKPVVVLFMCNHCPFVIPKFDELKELQDEFGEDIPLVLINSNNNPAYEEDDWDHSVALAKEKGYTYYLFDETQEVAKAYGAECTPDPYVFDKDHKLVYHGRINDDTGRTNNPTEHDLKEVLQAVKEGKVVEDWFRPSQGCNIKWNE